jgi:hypothetical protein
MKKETIQDKITEVESELSELKSRARNAGYKNVMPKLSEKLKFYDEGLQEGIMCGFYKRLSNWKQGLIIMENPGGLVYANVLAKKEEELKISTNALMEHFNG